MAQASLTPYSNLAEDSQSDRQEQPEQQTLGQPGGAREHLVDHRVAAKYSMFEERNPPNPGRPQRYSI